MFLNHLVHHRAQLGVYLRLNDETGSGDLRSFGGRHSRLLVLLEGLACRRNGNAQAICLVEEIEFNSYLIFADVRARC